jgi:lipopolysaccharide export system protein LptA
MRGGALACAAMLAALAAQSALAERDDKLKPANVTADHSTLDDLHQVEILTGHVVLIKGTMRLTGERMEHHQDEKGYQFYVVTAAPDQLATFHERRDPVREGIEQTLDGVGERIEYDDKSEVVTLIRQADVKRFENGEQRDEISGSKIVYDSRKASYEVDGKSADGSGGRVIMHIAPRNGPGATAPATPATARATVQLPPGTRTPASPLDGPTPLRPDRNLSGGSQ